MCRGAHGALNHSQIHFLDITDEEIRGMGTLGSLTDAGHLLCYQIIKITRAAVAVAIFRELHALLFATRRGSQYVLRGVHVQGRIP